MVWRWGLGVLALLVLLLCWTRAGVLITLGEAVRVDVQVGWLRFQVVPGKKRRPKEKKPPKEEKERKDGPFQSRRWRIFRMWRGSWSRH